MAESLALHAPLAGMRRFTAGAKARAEALVRAYPRESVGLGILTVIGLTAAIGITAAPSGDGAHAAPPTPPPLVMRDVAPQQALQLNAQIPVTQGPNPAALPFQFSGNAASRAQALQCLASAVYYEAGSQDDDGERAVAQVVLNRVRHPAFPSNICSVVYEGSTRTTGCQFTFTCDGSLNRQPDAEGWKRATRIAQAALSGYVYAPVGWATHYHANYVLPTWASTMAKNAIVGAHLFYRWSGGWGQPTAFTDSYAGREPNAAALRTAALAVPHITPVYGQQGQLAAAIKDIPGAEEIKLEPSMRGDKRVAVRFNLTARKAADEAVHEDYVKKFDASPNLKMMLGDTTAAAEEPLGSPTASGAATAAGGALASGKN